MNRLRVVTLSLFILALVAGGLPVTESLAKWVRRPAAGYRKKGHYRKYSRAWWRRHRARQRARRARALQRRLRFEAQQAARGGRVPARTSAPDPAGAFRPAGAFTAPNAAVSIPNAALSPAPAATPRRGRAAVRGGALLDSALAAPPAQMPFFFSAPHTWGPPRRAASGGVQFTVRTASGQAVGTATLEPVRPPRDGWGAPLSARAKTVGGVAVAALRRTVIDRMVAEGGWVTNDYVREIEGRGVFVVVAQTGAPGAPTQSLSFYFTEIEGRVYSLSTNVPVELAEPAAAGSEQLMASLKAAARGNLVMQK